MRCIVAKLFNAALASVLVQAQKTGGEGHIDAKNQALRPKRLLSFGGFLASLLTFCVLPTYGHATTIVADNLDTTFTGGGQIGYRATTAGYFNSGTGQTFTASSGGTLETITLKHYTSAPAVDPLLMDIFKATGGNITGASLGQVSIPLASIPPSGTHYETDFDFSSFGIDLIAGDSYGFIVHTARGIRVNFRGQYGAGFSSQNTYAGGNGLLVFNGLVGGISANPSTDLAFRVSVGGSESAAIPEPATIALFGLGLAGLGFARRRKSA